MGAEDETPASSAMSDWGEEKSINCPPNTRGSTDNSPIDTESGVGGELDGRAGLFWVGLFWLVALLAGKDFDCGAGNCGTGINISIGSLEECGMGMFF